MNADREARARLHFTSLNCEQQAEAVRRLAVAGHAESTIARATGLSIEAVRAVLTYPGSSHGV
jgi:hypothetical protein